MTAEQHDCIRDLVRRCRNNSNSVQPDFHGLRPGGYRQRGATQTVTVAALSVDVQLRRNLGVL